MRGVLEFSRAWADGQRYRSARNARKTPRGIYLALVWPTLADICAKDAKRCDREVAGRQLSAREMSGLCVFVLEEARNAYAQSKRPWAKDPKAPFDEAATITACMKLPPEEKVCIVRATTRAERTACMTKLAPKLGL